MLNAPPPAAALLFSLPAEVRRQPKRLQRFSHFLNSFATASPLDGDLFDVKDNARRDGTTVGLRRRAEGHSLQRPIHGRDQRRVGVRLDNAHAVGFAGRRNFGNDQQAVGLLGQAGRQATPAGRADASDSHFRVKRGDDLVAGGAPRRRSRHRAQHRPSARNPRFDRSNRKLQCGGNLFVIHPARVAHHNRRPKRKLEF